MAAPLTKHTGINPADAALVLDTDAARSDWLKARRQGIGSSDVSALVGLSAYTSAYELWLDKTGQMPLLDGWPSEEAEMGTLLEPVVRERFARVHDLTVTVPGMFRSVAWPWMLANPDGICSDGAGLEIKTCSQWSAADWDDEQVADHAELQAQWCMAVTGLHTWHVAVLIGGQHNRYRTVERDPDLIAHLVEQSRQFWQGNVEARVEPELGGTPSVTEYLASRFPTANEGTAALVDEDTAAELERAKAKAAQAVKDATAEHDAIKNRVKKLIGDAERLETPSGKKVATWKQINSLNGKRFTSDNPDLAAAYTREITRTGLDTTALAAEHPEVYAHYRTRQLTFTTH